MSWADRAASYAALCAERGAVRGGDLGGTESGAAAAERQGRGVGEVKVKREG